MQPNQMPRQLRAIYDLLRIEDESALAGNNPERIVQWLYRILDILDSKTSHLLRLDAIILAAQIFLLNGILGLTGAPRWALPASVFFALVPFLGTVAAMWVFRVEWPFLGWQKTKLLITDRRQVDASMQQEFVDLAKVCDRRTSAHQLVWWVTLVSIVLLLPSVLIRFLVA